MQILAINCGSSTIKVRLGSRADRRLLAEGVVERVGEARGAVRLRLFPPDGPPREAVLETPVADHACGLDMLVERMAGEGRGIKNMQEEISGVGHRVVHGGEHFAASAVIDDGVVEKIRALMPLAPLHNPANLAGITVARRLFPRAIQVAVFDTAFHQSMPEHAFRYGLPRALYGEHRIRRYGFHGTSHRHISRCALAMLGLAGRRSHLITLHLGSGCSVTAVKDGCSLDTSMGFTPLSGLIMGTRCGDIDPVIPFFLSRQLGMGQGQIEELLNRESGLKGICGDNDLRDIHRRRRQGDPQAKLAFAMFCYSVKKQIGAYAAVLGALDALVFSAGIGENDPETRSACCEGLEWLGIHIDPVLNWEHGCGARAIQSAQSRVAVLVVPTDEELAITQETLGVLASAPGSS